MAAYLVLVVMEKDTNDIYDVFSLRIVPGMLIYGIPGILACCLLLRYFVRKNSIFKSTVLAISIGVSVTFTPIIISLQFMKYLDLL